MNQALQTKKILIAAPVHSVLTDGLRQLGYSYIIHEKISQGEAPALLADCVGVITSTRLLLDKTLIDAAPHLSWIARMGSGMEVMDVPYATSRGIACISSPEGNCNAVGEHALGLLLSVIRKVATSNREVLSGIWKRDENRGIELEGRTVGIIGYGHTGQAFARKLSGFDVSVCAYDKYNPGAIHPHIHSCSSLQDVFDRAEIISFHVPLQPDTRHYFNEEFVQRMAKPFVLINTSRGPVVDTVALHGGLKSGKVIAAALDVFEFEPISATPATLQPLVSEILAMPNVIATPHIAGYTFEALYKMSKTLLEKIGQQVA